MFDYSNMIERAIKFFPTWTDIRKRKDKSIGGQLLKSTLNESIEIEKAIEEYKNFYFLDKYENKEDDVLAYVYYCHVGQIENLSNITVSYNNKNIPLTTNIDIFYNDKEYVYYENGDFYIHIEKVLEDNLKLHIDINSYSYSYNLTKKSVWNIFDEFACFAGLERHENESNLQLKNRIIYSMKNPRNNSEEGLKNSIISELMSFIDIEKDDIKIEKLTPENLIKPYKEFNSLLDMLSKLNRDVLKDKKWDLDKWSYPFKSITFLDNVWDSAVEDYQNGIGYKDDLKVSIADNDNTTDATITLFNKSEKKLEEYVQNANLKKDITFKLKRYENILTPMNAKYQITASEAIDITNEDIVLSAFENSEKIEKRKIEEIYEIGEGISVVDNSKISDNNNYRLEFYSDQDFDNMKITKANVIYKHRTTGEILETKNLLKSAPGFALNASGELVNTSIKKSIKSVSYFNSYENLQDTDKGIVITPNSNSGKGVINVSGLGLNMVRFDYEHETIDLPKSLIKYNKYCFWRQDDLILRYDIEQERRIDINVKANQLTFDIKEGEVDLFIKYGSTSKYEKVKGPCTWSSEIFDQAQDMQLNIISNHYGATTLNNFKYSCHSIQLDLQYGSLIKDNDNNYRLPNFAINNLVVTMSSESSSTPILKAIYIGGDTQQLRYRTEIIPPKTNADRIIQISTNVKTDLLKVDALGNVLSKTENYIPATSYKAIKDNAWIRLDTNEYQKVNEIKSDIGSIQLIEESGKIYYNLVLKNGQIANMVTIDGLKNTAAKEITLEQMVKMYFPEFDIATDKIYASRISDNLIISDNDPDNPQTIQINIKSDIFKGIDAYSYKFTKLPDTLMPVFNNGVSKVQSYETKLAFNSLSFIPGGTKEYYAINESNLYTGELRNINILNNFSPILNDSSLMYFKVEPMNTELNYDVRFCTDIDNNKSFEDLTDWCLGRKKIAIKTPIDLNNTENYEINEIEVTDEVLLNRYIEIKDSYKLANNNEIITSKYMIIPEDNNEILFERYSDNSNPNLIIYEEVIMEEDGFTKLNYSNIDELLYIGLEPYTDKNEIKIQDYQLIKDEGIMLWTNKEYIAAAKKVYLKYLIKKPIAILLSEEDLYKAIGYNVDAYEEINRINLENITDKTRFDLKAIEGYEDADLVYTVCSSASFQSEGTDNILTFNKTASKDTILVKTGYYYINGREYYLFPSKDEIEIENTKYIDMENVDIVGEEIILSKKTNNYVRNSEMLFRGINELYNYDASKSTGLEGVSNIKSLTACDSFDKWKTFGMKMILKNGLNELGINFIPEINNAYAYINLSEYLVEGNNYISFWADKDLKVYIGEDKKYLDLEFPDAINIDIKSEIKYNNDNIRSYIIDKKDRDVYMIIKGTGTIDDIIINDKEEYISLHKKNIDKLGLKIQEEFKSGQRHRVFIEDNKDIINKGANLTFEGKIKTASNMYWGISPIISYTSKEDFYTCTNYNVHIENDYINTLSSEGYVETQPIFIDNVMTIKRLVFKTNDIAFDDMSGFKVQLYACNTRNGEYVPINMFNSNYGYVYGDRLLKYVKFKIMMPPYKYLNNFSVYVEYKSTEDNAPKVLMPTSGYLLTKIYDTQYSTDYKIKDINIESISNINDVEIYVRTSRDDYSADVWFPWERIHINRELKMLEELEFNNTRFFQFKILIKTSMGYIKINNIDIEVI